MKNCPNVN